ncbi:MAG: tRNA-ribosyltransferase family protein, partial [Chloroflexia bacterium]
MQDGRKRRATLTLPHGTLKLPAFLPDATRGVVPAVDARDLRACGVSGLQANVFHLMQKPGTSVVQALGGLHRMMGWEGPIVTDSGGFQAYSLIRQNEKFGRLDERGILFRPEGGRRVRFTPEKSIQLQFRYGADILICLDDCTHPRDARSVQEESVRRTVDWARRCKAEFERLVEEKGLPPGRRPLLFAVIQGGALPELRRRCAEELLAIGFDGFGYGGWPLDDAGRLLTEIIAYVRDLVPPAYPLHALGVGHPAHVVTCVGLGYDLLDSVMPTRDARHGRLYVWEVPPEASLQGDWFSYLYIGDGRHIRADEPLSPYCDCLTCTHYGRGYLHHLFKLGDALYLRLATVHNLRFMMRLMERVG